MFFFPKRSNLNDAIRMVFLGISCFGCYNKAENEMDETLYRVEKVGVGVGMGMMYY